MSNEYFINLRIEDLNQKLDELQYEYRDNPFSPTYLLKGRELEIRIDELERVLE